MLSPLKTNATKLFFPPAKCFANVKKKTKNMWDDNLLSHIFRVAVISCLSYLVFLLLAVYIHYNSHYRPSVSTLKRCFTIGQLFY